MHATQGRKLQRAWERRERPAVRGTLLAADWGRESEAGPAAEAVGVLPCDLGVSTTLKLSAPAAAAGEKKSCTHREEMGGAGDITQAWAIARGNNRALSWR